MQTKCKNTNKNTETGECYRITCASDKKSYTVHTYKNSTEKLDFVCDAKDKKSEGLEVDIEFTCEDPAVICNNITSCADDCNFK